MAIPTVNVTATLYDEDGIALVGATITAKLSRTDTYQGQFVSNSTETYTTDGSGQAVMALFPNVLGEKASYYKISAVHPITGRTIIRTTAYVQNAASTLVEIMGTLPLTLTAAEAESVLPVSMGGTGASDAITARANLGLSLGEDVQAWDTDLDWIAANVTAAGKALIDDADSTAQRATLGLGTMAIQAAIAVAIAGGTIDNTAIGATTPAAITGTTITANTEFRGTVLTSNSASAVQIKNSGGAVVTADYTASAVNSTRFFAQATGGAPGIDFTGSDVDISGAISTKGAGILNFQSNAYGANQLRVTHTALSVNILSISGNATGFSPIASWLGSDTNVGGYHFTKGVGAHDFATGGGVQFRVSSTPSSVNYPRVNGGSTSNGTAYYADGADTNVQAAFFTKGTGAISFTTGPVYAPQFVVGHTASAVDYGQISGAISGGRPYFASVGSDANIGVRWIAKGTGLHSFQSDGGSPDQFTVARTASAVNNIQATGAATAGGPSMLAIGSDVDVFVGLRSKGNAVSYQASNGNTAFEAYNSSASAVNYARATGNATGNGPSLKTVGSDVNPPIYLTSKGTGSVFFNTNDGAQSQFEVAHVASAVNRPVAQGSATGNFVSLFPSGTDVNVGVYHLTKGTSSNQFATGGGLQGQFSNTNSAVNYANIFGAATGSAPFFSVAGSDTNIQVGYESKGTGVLNFRTGGAGGVTQMLVQHAALAVNYINITGGATGARVGAYALGSDADVTLSFSAKGVQSIPFYTNAYAQKQFQISHAASAVNYLQALGAATASLPNLAAIGSDTNISGAFSGTGAGGFYIYTNSFNQLQMVVAHTASAVNYLQIQGAVAGGAVPLSAVGSNANIDINITPKGAGRLVAVTDVINLTTTKTPASAAAAGTTGDHCWDSNYLYVCTATNTWKRAALSTW